MLVPKRWPTAPPEWQELNARYTAELAALPLCEESAFSDRQFEVTHLASLDKSLAETATAMDLSEKTVGGHRTRALAKIGASGLSMSRLVYCFLDSGLLVYEADPQPIELSPAGGIALKGVLLGYDGVEISGRMPGRTREEVREDVQEISGLLGAETEPGLVARVYQIGLCVPRAVLSGDPAGEYRY